MAQWRESRRLDVPVNTAFDIVADVAAYPEFLPLWQRAEVVMNSADAYETVQTVGIGMLAHRFRTRTTLARPRSIVVRSADSVFRTLLLRWRFRPDGDFNCRVDFDLDCDVAAWWLKPAIESMMASTAQTMIDAFERRARALQCRRRAAA
jgi:coenzyme Q-binding protein COQ10